MPGACANRRNDDTRRSPPSQLEAKGTGRKSYSPETAAKFKESDNVYVASALAIELTKGRASVTLALFKGVSPKGEAVYYIITDASDFDVAKLMGLNSAPKLKHAVGSPGVQMVGFPDSVIDGTTRTSLA